jgi:hypothetical protein
MKRRTIRDEEERSEVDMQRSESRTGVAAVRRRETPRRTAEIGGGAHLDIDVPGGTGH